MRVTSDENTFDLHLEIIYKVHCHWSNW